MNRSLALLVLGWALASPAQQSRPVHPSGPSNPAQDSQLYRNSTLGFGYRIPFGWVDRTKDMQEGSEAGKGEILLAIFERPPQAAGDTVNSAVVIATESASSYPGLKTAADYVGPLNEVTAAKGFKSAGDPTEVTIDGRTLVRADFVKALSEKLTMHQTTLVMLAKGQIVSFTFIAGGEEEVDDLIDGLSLAAQRSRPH